MKRFFCDCCNKEFEPSDSKMNGSTLTIRNAGVTFTIEVSIRGATHKDQRADLCKTCKVDALLTAINE